MTPDEIENLLDQVEEAGLARVSYPASDEFSKTEASVLLLSIVAKRLRMEASVEDEFAQLRLLGPEEPRRAAVEAYGKWHLPEGWEARMPRWIACLEEALREAA